MMYDREKSDLAIVAVKPTNKAGQPAGQGRRERSREEFVELFAAGDTR